ncbi:MAG: hypothetical protein RI933_1235 [Actinomycetota bacterium]
MPKTNIKPIDELAVLITDRVLELVDEGTPTPIVLIDGRAGSGKSTLAEKLQNELFRKGESAPRIIHMDDLYEGWDGLEAGSDYLHRMILRPLVNGKFDELGKRQRQAEWQEFDWAENARTGNWREFRGGTPLIVEGCGSLSAANAELANLTVWLEVDEPTRYQRWVNREGNDEFFGRWAAQELEFYAREKSAEIAELVGA